MADFLIPAYTVIFIALTLGSLRMAVEAREPWWILVLEIVSAPVILAGFLLFHLNHRPDGIETIWRFVGPVAVWAYGYLMWRDIRSLEPDPELSETEDLWIAVVGSAISILFFSVAFWFNLKLAFAP